ncbi:3'-5' exonuclease [Gulosibacter sp. 10]|uniref:3'-5' exonuclease n=1 Tax=Gulosibacter sp. 10 TaxID=1255570 RepID=UPI00097EB959|nr:3'-5' exonuclease [Gulosibacter sp. 10]SJM53038.1 DNA polymerase III subunit epsilon [Gulosibacter sp. 10]
MTWTDRIAVFDTETTGVDPAQARLVTAFVGLLDAEGELERGSDWLADPGVEIPERAAAVHGITTEIARAEGAPIAEVLQKIADSLAWIARHGIALVIYNAPYDLTLFEAECRRHGVEPPQLGPQVVDPLVIDRAVDKYRRGKRTLTDTAAVYEVELMDAHDAASDSLAAGRVALALARRYPEQVAIPLDALHEQQVRWAREQAEDFQAYMRRTKDPEFVAEGDWPVRPS